MSNSRELSYAVACEYIVRLRQGTEVKVNPQNWVAGYTVRWKDVIDDPWCVRLPWENSKEKQS